MFETLPRTGRFVHFLPLRLAAIAFALLPTVACPAAPAPADKAAEGPGQAVPSLVLLTLDTTRADALGSYRAGGVAGPARAATPVLDSLAARGRRFAHALTASPLTLPAHASLLTGLAPPEHGVRDNGTAVLSSAVPTLATILRRAGYTTAAFVASRVLDRRFGLGEGFDHYDDQMAAELVGEYGYPERDAAAVTEAALEWLRKQPAGQPFFLWVHYYDPHAPYTPPAGPGHGDPAAAYAGEISYMDQQIGRLLDALPRQKAPPLIAAVGDHGEALGEHGERTHGLFLYRSTLEVPLILSGPGVPQGEVEDEVVASRRLAPTLLHLLDLPIPEAMPAPLPGTVKGATSRPQPVYSEAQLPASAYGWSPLEAISDQRWRLMLAPRPELYDFVADPGETKNVIGQQRAEARRLRDTLAARKQDFVTRQAAAPEADGELTAALRSLGYLSGSSGSTAREVDPRGIDPKDGLLMLEELETAKGLLQAGNAAGARRMLEDLVKKSPGNVPFHTHLGRAQLATGDAEAAIATLRKAAGLNPRLHFLHLHLADAYRLLGRLDEAQQEYELVVEINPRAAEAWLALGEFALRSGKAGEERRVLEKAVAAGTQSAAILARLGQVELEAGSFAAAEGHLREATRLLPSWHLPWFLLGKLQLRTDDPQAARSLQRVLELAPTSPQAQEARRLLGAGAAGAAHEK